MKGFQTPPSVEQRVCRAYRKGLCAEDVGEMYGMARSTVYAILGRNGVAAHGNRSTWTAVEDEFLIQHYNVDRTASEIGIALKRNKGAVIGRANRLGLSQPLNSAAAMEGNNLKTNTAMRA